MGRDRQLDFPFCCGGILMKQAFSGLMNRWLPPGGLTRSVSILVGGTAIAQAIAVVASPVLTRIYHPSDFGALQVFISLTGFVMVIAAGRYEFALLLPEDEQSSVDLLGVAIFCVCLTTVVTAVIVAMLQQYHWKLPVGMTVLKRYLWLLPIGVLGGGLYQALSYRAMRQNAYRQIATTKLTQVVAMIAIQLGAGLVIHGPLGLLTGDAVGRVTGSGRFLRELWRKNGVQIRGIRLARMIRLAVRYRDYPLVSIWGGLLNASGLALPALFLAQCYGAQYTGWFALVNRVLGVPAALIGASIAQVYTSQAAQLSRTDPQRLLYIFLETTRRMLILGFIPCALFTLFAPWIFQTIFGRVWREAGEYARYLTFMCYASFINSPVTLTLSVLQRQRIQFVWDGAKLTLTALSFTLPYHFGYGPRVAILFYGVAMTLMYCIHWALSHAAIKHCAAAGASLTNMAEA
jgi:O-antigen/teichoic acid export membrane protein